MAPNPGAVAGPLRAWGVRAFTLAGGRTSGPRLGLRPALLIFGCAVLVRVGYVLAFLQHYRPQSDAAHYREIAANIADGQGITSTFPYVWDHATAFRPPLYPIVLGGAFKLFGNHVATAQALNIALGSAVVVMCALLATRIGGRRAGAVAAVVAAVFPPLIANDTVPLSEPLGLLLMLLAIWALLAGRAGWAGVCVGLLMLTRPSAQLLAPLLAIVLLRQVGWRRAVLFVVAAAAVITPWLARNDVVFGKPVLVTSNGFNLAAIYSPAALAAHEFVDPVFDKRFENVRDYDNTLANFNEVNLDNAFRDEGLRGIREHPGRVPGILWTNVRRLVDQAWQLNDGAEKADGRNLRVRHDSLPFVWVVEIAGLVSLLSMIRLAHRRYRSRREAVGRDPAGRLGPGLVPLFAGYFFAVSVVTVSVPRLRAPVDVMLIIAIGAGAAQLWRHWRTRRSADPQRAVGILDQTGDVQPAGVIPVTVLPQPVAGVGDVELPGGAHDR